eukprot:CCRYP_015331-RA/>CCRYP_015331-RA protein AED:0.04 eAED:0.04 QI:112/1/1/1/1/1/2/197/952
MAASTVVALWLLSSGAALFAPFAKAYTPTAYLDIRRTHSNVGGVNIEYLFRIEATESDFAPQPPKGHRSYNTNPLGKSSQLPSAYSSFPVDEPPASDLLLCNEANGISNYLNPVGTVDVQDVGYLYKKYVLVPRGQCSFEAKARSAQRLGAAGIMIFNTLESRYEAIDPNKEYTDDSHPDWGNIQWPEDRADYECGDRPARDGIGLRFEVQTSSLHWTPPPYADNNLMSGWVNEGSWCAKDFESKGGTADEFRKSCPSERCLVTGKNVSDDGSIMEACCAWDIPITMQSDGIDDGDAVPQSEEEKIVIPVLFLTMDDGEMLNQVILDAMDSANLEGLGDITYISVVPYARWYPEFHYSTIVLWAMAVFTLWISCYESASEYRKSWKNINTALNEGLLVFSRSSVIPSSHLASAVGGGRERTDTDETVDLAEDVELEVEMPATNVVGNGESVSQDNDVAQDSNFQIDDECEPNADDTLNAATATPPDNAFPESRNSNIDDDTLHTDAESVISETVERMDAIGAVGPTTDRASGTSSNAQGEQLQTQRVNAQSLLRSRPPTASERRVELHAMHAFFFVLCASAFLLLLFFFNLFKLVTVAYGLGGSSCMSQIIFQPLYARVLKEKHSQKEIKLPSFLGNWRVIDVISSLSAYSIGIVWIVIAFSSVQPLYSTYYWVVQDVMGVSYCIFVLGIIQINTIMVGTILLVLVFFYDIFYVFLSPYIFGTSVMVDVAMGGKHGDPAFCYKYPSDYRCTGSQAPLPMMLVFPWLLDYREGFSMIGLGDIVLPGLLISFAARYDGAKFLTRKCSEASSGVPNQTSDDNVDEGTAAAAEDMEYTPPLTRKQVIINNSWAFLKGLKKGYFGPMMVAYAIGLSAAYVAVYGMQRGQPALLYIVPACLLTMFALGMRKRQLSDLWGGPKVMRKANRMVALADKIPEFRAAAATAPRSNLPQSAVV